MVQHMIRRLIWGHQKRHMKSIFFRKPGFNKARVRHLHLDAREAQIGIQAFRQSHDTSLGRPVANSTGQATKPRQAARDHDMTGTAF